MKNIFLRILAFFSVFIFHENYFCVFWRISFLLTY
jgi:hypothetical protein